MTYKYDLNNFLSTPSSNDTRLFIYDKDRNLVDSIMPSLSHYFVRNNCLIIKITNRNDMILSFVDTSTAKQALSKLDVIVNENF